MATKKIKSIGERGFLARLLPLLQKKSALSFLVPPGDDAAVLKSSSRPVLSIDGLTEGTHFLWSWKRQCEKNFHLPFGRVLGWKLMGSALSDLAAMGQTKNRWAMIYLGAPSFLDMKFLMDFYKGVRETADQHNCVLAGGDTVRARDLTLVAAVGADSMETKALTRSGARPGDWVAVAGHVGDAAMGLNCLLKKNRLEKEAARYFVKRFFQHQPLFKEGDVLARTSGVSSLMDLSDGILECLQLLTQSSSCGADIHIEGTPISKPYAALAAPEEAFARSGEDYALLFTASTEALKKLSPKMSFSILGRVTMQKNGLRLFKNGKPFHHPSEFNHFA